MVPDIYTVIEDKTQLGGYDTWAVAGELTVDGIKADSEAKSKTTISNLSPNESDGIDGCFLNEKNDDKIIIYGEKQWDDLDNIFDLRPADGKLELNVQSIVGAQTGQGNQVGWRVVDPSTYVVT